MPTLTVASHAIRCVLHTKSKGVTIMTTVNNPNASPLAGREEEGPKQKGFFNRPRRWLGDKSFWDWMQLLIIPLVLAVGGLMFTAYQHNTDQQSALDQQRAAILQTYIDNIQDLLLNHNLLGDTPLPKNDADNAKIQEVQELARARTLTALQGLDTARKGLLVQFLYEAHLIGFLDSDNKPKSPIVNLKDADLTQVNLEFVDLKGVNLSGADLSGANFTLSNLRGANFSVASLRSATLHGTYLIGADLLMSDLTAANLNAATVTQQQLDVVRSCENVVDLPKGLTCNRIHVFP